MRGASTTSRWLRLAATIAGLLALAACEPPSVSSRYLYAVNESANNAGTISIYDINAGHRLVRTIQTVPNVADIRGVAGSPVTGKLYVAYHDKSDAGMIYCLDIYTDAVLWNREVPVGIDRISIDPKGRLVYAPTGEDRKANFIQVLDASNGDVVRQVYFSKSSHDTLYPLSGPLFQETKADDGSGNYLYMIDPDSYAVSRFGPYAGILGPYSVDGASHYAVNNVSGIRGMQVADLKTGQIVTANIPDAPRGRFVGHGIGWTPDQTEVWEVGGDNDPHIYVWDMRDPMAPVLKQRLPLRSGRRAHWVNFDLKGEYGYVAPGTRGGETEIFSVPTHSSVGVIPASEELLEIDMSNGRINRMGDQFGIGRREPLMRPAA